MSRPFYMSLRLWIKQTFPQTCTPFFTQWFNLRCGIFGALEMSLYSCWRNLRKTSFFMILNSWHTLGSLIGIKRIFVIGLSGSLTLKTPSPLCNLFSSSLLAFLYLHCHLKRNIYSSKMQCCNLGMWTDVLNWWNIRNKQPNNLNDSVVTLA